MTSSWSFIRQPLEESATWYDPPKNPILCNEHFNIITLCPLQPSKCSQRKRCPTKFCAHLMFSFGFRGSERPTEPFQTSQSLISSEVNGQSREAWTTSSSLLVVAVNNIRLAISADTVYMTFFSLQILGIDSEFCIVESFVTGMVDNWPEVLRPHRKKFTLGMCVVMMVLGIPMVTHVSAV